MVNRRSYLDIIKLHKDEPLVKIITGIRHSGKSFFLLQYIEILKASGIREDHIIHVNLDNPVFCGLRTAREIENFITAKTKTSGKFYVILDEIQTVTGWEKTINTLVLRKKFDIYIVASAADLLSKKALAKKDKKWIKIDFKTLSYSEFKENNKAIPSKGIGLLKRAIAIRKINSEQFNNYILSGGFPDVPQDSVCNRKARLQDIYSSIIFRDVVQRFNIRNIELLERIIKCIFENIGKENSTKKIEDYLTEQKYKKNLSLVYQYIKALENAFIVKRVYRYNIISGKIIRTNIKYFIEDHALLNAVMDINEIKTQGLYENIIVNDLQHRNFDVYSGKLEDLVIDIVAIKDDKIVFIELLCNVEAKEKYAEKMQVFNALNDVINTYVNQKKRSEYLVSLTDPPVNLSRNKIVKYVSLPSFLILKDL